MGGRVVAIGLVSFLLLSVLSVSPPVATHLEERVEASHTSGVNIVFSNGPAEDESVTGLKTVTFALSGSGTIDSILVEIAEVGSAYATVTNLTGTPWLFNLDSTSYTNGTYTLRATGWDTDVSDFTISTTDEFTIDNHIPEITAFTVLSPDVGSGAASTDRAWFNVSETGTLEFRYGISDDDFDRATLQNVPGPGSPSADGPTSLAYGWDWSSGSFSEGTWNPRLTVFDDSGLSSSETIFIGIDRTGPTMSSVSVGNGNTWQSTTSISISGILDAANDGSGSGVDFVELQIDDGTWTSLTSNTHTIELSEGNHSLSWRATDRVGNTGNTVSDTIRIDTSMPELVGWTVDPLTTDLIGIANISYATYDLLSGVDESTVSLQYGFDSNGVGQTPDQDSGSNFQVRDWTVDWHWPTGQQNLVNTSCFVQRLPMRLETPKQRNLKPSKSCQDLICHGMQPLQTLIDWLYVLVKRLETSPSLVNYVQIKSTLERLSSVLKLPLLTVVRQRTGRS